ncbi:MAG TPA: helix-turn-helix transcriptional regulator [Candidatus Obscuribacterales bacterium]
MALQSGYGFGVAVSTTVEISKETQRSLLCEIEAQLYDSEIYHRAMAGLQTMLGGAVGTAQILVKAVGREAIRLAFQQFCNQYKEITPVASHETITAPEQQLASPLPIVVEDSSANAAVVSDQDKPNFNAAPENLESVAKVSSSTPTILSFPRPSENTAKVVEERASKEREERLRQIGEELKQARQARSLPIEQLHNETLVPIRHIEALETGCVDTLPEDVFVRGFIRQLGNALRLDGAAMADSLPAAAPVKYGMPSWYQSQSTPGFPLASVQSYVGYAALVAGAVGGLGWLSQHSTSGTLVKPDPDISSPAPVSHSADRAEPSGTPGVNFRQKGVTIGADIAPPEAIKH